MDIPTPKKNNILDLVYEESLEDIKLKIKEECNTEYNVAYRSIIDKAAKFYKSEFKNTNLIDTSIVLEYMLWNGYFSKDKHFTFSSYNRRGGISNFGAYIVNGNGVCRDNSVIIADLLNALGYEAIPVVCNVKNTKKEKIGNPKGLIRNISKVEKNRLLPYLIELTGILDKFGNHAITLCRDHDYALPIDATNLAFVNNTELYKGKINDTGFEYTYVPFSTGVGYGIDKYKIDDLLMLSINSYKQSLKEMKDNYAEVINQCNDKKELFDDYYKETENDINQVVKTLNKKTR